MLRRWKEALALVRKPVWWIEPLIRPRLVWLTTAPGSYLIAGVSFALMVAMPLLDIIPTMSSFAAIALAFFSAGFVTRDGVLMLIGLAWVGIGATAVSLLLA